MNIHPAYWETIQKLMEEFPGTEESTSYGTPAFKVKKKLLLRLREDWETLVIHSDDRDIWIDKDPDVFYVTDHYRNYPYVLVNLKKVKKAQLKAVIIQSWKEMAPKKLLDTYEAGGKASR